MRNKIRIGLFITLASFQGCSIQHFQKAKNERTASTFEQVDFDGLVSRYLKKEKFSSIEGIYTVSGSVTKKGKGFMASNEKEKTTDRKENYAKVAIIKDPGDTGRDFIEISLDGDKRASYSIVGEFNTAADGSILVYKHIEAKNKITNFTFTTDQKSIVLEGIRVENEGSTTVTYKLTYLKIFPK